jgi:BlaI family penicillinase repressor
MEDRRITDAEWHIMRILWSRPSASLADLMEGTSEERGWQRTTVQTLLKRLADKGFVNVEALPGAYRYSAAVAEADCVRTETKTFLQKIYDGSAGMLVAGFLRDNDLTAAEIDALRKILDGKEEERHADGR